MDFKPQLGLRTSLHLVMTEQLQLAIRLLQLSRLELIDMVREELNQNPILEEGAEAPDEGRVEMAEMPSIDQMAEIEQRREGAAQGVEEKAASKETTQEEFWDRYLEQAANQPNLPTAGLRGNSDELPSLEQTLSSRTSLSDHLMAQLRMSNLTEEEMTFAALVVHNLDDDGYLNLKAIPPDILKVSRKRNKAAEGSRAEGSSESEEDGDAPKESKAEAPAAPVAMPEAATRTLTVEDLAEEVGMHPEDAEEVLKMIQHLDPVGVASRDLRECLLVQAEELGYDDENVVWQVIDRHLQNLERRNFGAIARDLKCELPDVFEAAKWIAILEPRPGRNFASEDPHYITPDVYVSKAGDEYVVSTNDDGLPRLKVNLEQARMLMKNPRARQFVQDKLQTARGLVTAIDRRQKTIVKVTQCIVEKQRDFFEKGIEHLKPMILRDVALAVNMHESTISRVTTNKWVHTPRGIFELKYFFNSSIKRVAEEDIASESVKQAIKKIVSEEEPKNPLSDEQIVKRLEQDNKILIARRTVAKYREMLGILSSAKRKQYY